MFEDGVGVCVFVIVGLTVGVGLTNPTKQLKSASKLSTSHDSAVLGVGVGQTELKNEPSKSGHKLVLLGWPDSTQVTPKYSDIHHLVAPEL